MDEFTKRKRDFAQSIGRTARGYTNSQNDFFEGLDNCQNENELIYFLKNNDRFKLLNNGRLIQKYK